MTGRIVRAFSFLACAFSVAGHAYAESVAERVFGEISRSYGGDQSGHRVMRTMIANKQVGDLLRYESKSGPGRTFRNDPRHAVVEFQFQKQVSLLTPSQILLLKLVDETERGEGQVELTKRTVGAGGIRGILGIFGIQGQYNGSKDYRISIRWKRSHLRSLDPSRLATLAKFLDEPPISAPILESDFFRGKGNYWVVRETFHISGLQIAVATVDGSSLEGGLGITSFGQATYQQGQAGAGTYALIFPDETEFLVSIKCEQKTFGDIRKWLGAPE
jgi:hypothetical protein